MNYIGLIFILVLAAVVIVVGRKGQKKSDAMMQLYATSHGYTYNNKPDNGAIFDLDIFTRPHSLSVRDFMTANNRSYATLYATEASSSDKEHNVSSNSSSTQYTACISTTSHTGANFILVPKGLSGMFIFKTHGLDNYKLEGNLSELYQLSIYPGSEVEALSMLTPDTLLYLSTNFPSTAVVARNGKLYVFYRKTFTYKAAPGTEYSPDVILAQINDITDKLLKIHTKKPTTKV